ncbi:MAG: lipoprotein signal peptidase [Pirellulaceae bacterium]|nr:MAG: lipoprotein signal peptidase [Pirellulaceae bacterium]
MRPRTGLRWLVFVLIAAVGAGVDLWTKSWVFRWRGLPGEQPIYWIWEPYVGIQTAVNPGALFGFGAGWGTVFAIFSILAAAGIGLWLVRYGAIESWWLVIALGCVMGGIAGNLYDRLGLWNPPPEHPDWASGVRDWILLQYGNFTWPNFNIADSLLVTGAVMLVIHSFAAGTETHHAESERETAPPPPQNSPQGADDE